MIKIIAGTFGYRKKGEAAITLYTSADGEIDLKDKKLEERLVKLGMAAYVEKSKPPAKKAKQGRNNEGIHSTHFSPDELPPDDVPPDDDIEGTC